MNNATGPFELVFEPRTESYTIHRAGILWLSEKFSKPTAERVCAALNQCSRLTLDAHLRAEVERLTKACNDFSNAEIAQGDWKARAEKAEAELKQTQSSALTWSRFAGEKAAGADIARQRAERFEAEVERLKELLRIESASKLLTGTLTHAGTCSINGEEVDGVFVAIPRDRLAAVRHLPMYQPVQVNSAEAERDAPSTQE